MKLTDLTGSLASTAVMPLISRITLYGMILFLVSTLLLGWGLYASVRGSGELREAKRTLEGQLSSAKLEISKLGDSCTATDKAVAESIQEKKEQAKKTDQILAQLRKGKSNVEGNPTLPLDYKLDLATDRLLRMAECNAKARSDCTP